MSQIEGVNKGFAQWALLLNPFEGREDSMKYPPPAETNIAYNVTFEDVPVGSDLTVWSSTPDPPPLTLQEEIKIRRGFLKLLLGESAPPITPKLTPLNESTLTDHSIQEQQGSRTVEISIGDPRILNLELLTWIQEFLADAWPLWRVRLNCQNSWLSSDSDDILIYPAAILVGPYGAEADLETVFPLHRDHLLSLYNEAYGEKIRRFEHVKQTLLTSPELLQKAETVLVAAFANMEDQETEFWVLFPKGKRKFRIIGDGDLEISHGREYPVTTDGQVGRWLEETRQRRQLHQHFAAALAPLTIRIQECRAKRLPRDSDFVASEEIREILSADVILD